MRSALLSVFTILLLSSASVAEPFAEAGLFPAVCLVSDSDPASVKDAVDLLRSEGARGFHVFPGGVIFGRMPSGIESASGGLSGAAFYRSPDDFRAACAGRLSPVVVEAAGNLLDGEEYRRCLLESAGGEEMTALDSGIKEHPPLADVSRLLSSMPEVTAAAGARKWPTQNSEFLIGTVLINIVFPQGSSLVETWTEDEFAQVVSSISTGLAELQQYTHWVDLDFFYNYSDFKWVPVDTEPCMTHWYDHETWITEALTSLGYPGKDSYLGTFELNNDTRAEFGTDWVFTAYIADMSDHWDPEMTYYDERCWGGWSEEHDSRSPVSYAMIGGPYLVVSHPACWLDYGKGFYRVFLHEMFHIFWAWDEYCGESCCYVRCGYFDVLNWNVCGPAELCVMQGVRYGPQLCLCNYTMMQMGLIDLNENSIPDVFDLDPEVEFLAVPGVLSDTIYTDEYMFSARAVNPVVENINPWQEERFPGDMIDYGATLSSGLYRINSGLAVELKPSDGKWDESREEMGLFINGFDPGVNILDLEVKNRVGRTAHASNEVYYVGLKYYSFSVAESEGEVVLDWLTAVEVFGARFEVWRRDLDTGSAYSPIDTVTVPSETSYNRRAYSYHDTRVTPGHTYGYMIRGCFDFFDGAEVRSFDVPTRELLCRAPFCLEGGCISRICPNPSVDAVSFTVEVPASWSQVDDQASSGRPRDGASSATEIKTGVDIRVYDVSGRQVRTLYTMDRFSGYLTLTWDGTDRNGVPVAQGVYFVHVKAGSQVSTRKVVIVR